MNSLPKGSFSTTYDGSRCLSIYISFNSFNFTSPTFSTPQLPKMHSKIVIALCAALFSSVALAANTPSDAQWEKQVVEYAQKNDIMDFGQYRTGMIDRNELAVRVAKVFNEAAFRSVGSCSNTDTGSVYTFQCDLTVPVIDKVVATVKLTMSQATTTLDLLIAGQVINLAHLDTAKFFSKGISVSVSSQLAKFGPPGMSGISSMLVADIIVKGADNKDGTSNINIGFKVGMAGPFGVAIPGMPAPKEITLITQKIKFAAPSMGFFTWLLNTVTFGLL